MNVLQLVPKLNVGGVERGTIEVARYLVAKGHKAVVASDGGLLEGKLISVGAKHYKLPVGKKNILSMVKSYFALREIIRKEEINLVHARSRIPALIGYFAAKKEKRVFITTAHGQYRKHLISRVMGWGKVVIVASDVMARHMRDNFGVDNERLVLIPRGVDLEKFAFSQRRPLDGRPLKVGMICRFTFLKGHLDFLEAVSIVSKKKKIKAVMMGDISSASDEYMKKIRMKIKKLAIEDIVEIKDSDRDVTEELRDLDVFVSANRKQEAFGRSIIEAQAAGVPVVATRVGGVVELIQDNLTGMLCEPDDSEDMSVKIIDLIDDQALREAIALRSRKYVEDNFSVKKMLDSILYTYEKVLRVKKILVFKISSFGDIILSIPTLRALRERFSGAVIKVLIHKDFRSLLAECPYIDGTISCDLKGRDKGLRMLGLAKRIKSQVFDLSFDLQNSSKSHLLAFLGMIDERYGFDNGKMSFFLNRKSKLPKESVAPVKQQEMLLRLIGITNIDHSLELWTDPDAEKWADDLINANWAGIGQKIVGISLEASRKWATKNWGVDKYSSLGEMLARSGIRVMLLGTAWEMDPAKTFEELSGAHPINAVGLTNIPQLISLIKRCDVMVSGDSSPIHIAAAMKTPFIALFGPTDPEKHAPPAAKYTIINKKIRCSPCYKSTCRRAHVCMGSIHPEEVYKAVLEYL